MEKVANQSIKTENLSHNIIIENIEDFNPWSVNDASVFLKYCCPECDYSDQLLDNFQGNGI